MTPFKILIIADDRLLRRILSQAIKNWGFTPVEASTMSESLELFDLHHPIATLLDFILPDGTGLDVLCEIKNRQPNAAVIMIADQIKADETLTAFRAGAADVIAKPINLEELQTAIGNSIKARERRGEVSQLPQEIINSFKFEQIIGESPTLKETISLARKVAASDVFCVLLQGESGTGKDLIAKAIHYSSPRARKPFVAINCAAIPPNLLESELFGYEKGAFTDAKARKEGLFEQAEGGTLFLDEIGDLDIGLQAKLLRVLEEGMFRRVGGLRDLPLNVRVVAASNRDLRTESETNNFRLDLYYRLSVIQIDLPPLRERGDDIFLLAAHFIKTLDKSWHRTKQRRLSPEVEDVFRRYPWAGNVRELRNVIERTVILEENELITMKYLPRELLAYEFAHFKNLNGEYLKTSRCISLPAEGISLDMVEMRLIQEALERSGGNVTRAGELLHVSRDRIRYRLKRNKLESKNGRNQKNGNL
jgi:two-component system, NtrC family, response regulator AtoC